MGFLNNIFGAKEQAVKTYQDFWNWFRANEKDFFNAVKTGQDIEKNFFEKLAPKLGGLKDGFYFLTGMQDEHTAELILTADGIIKNIVFVEELVDSAPALPNWKITALKPATNINNLGIAMEGYTFNGDNLAFYPVEHAGRPDEVDLVVVYDDYPERDHPTVTNGVYIFIDNYLGELHSVTAIDRLVVVPKSQAAGELIPIGKLGDYLVWREKEFVEKYAATRHNTEEDRYASFEAELENGTPLLSVINTTLLDWDAKASHPWMLAIEVPYDGRSNHGLPDKRTYELLDRLEDEMMKELRDADGYLNVGRQTGDGNRIVYFACREFRKPSAVLHKISAQYAKQFAVSYDIYKDKYWNTFDMYRQP